VTINCPLHPETEHLFDAEMLKKMKPGSFLVNTARGKIVQTDALVEAVESGHIEGYAGEWRFDCCNCRRRPVSSTGSVNVFVPVGASYASTRARTHLAKLMMISFFLLMMNTGDVWFPQPAPATHPWRNMPRHALTPHISGTSLDAQARYAAGVKEILQVGLCLYPLFSFLCVIFANAAPSTSPLYNLISVSALSDIPTPCSVRAQKTIAMLTSCFAHYAAVHTNDHFR
jgi:formate dehydrogenase